MPIVGYCRNLHTNLCSCFVCGKKFSLDNGIEDLLTHICFTHKIIIENIDKIADFKKYMEYYIKRYQMEPIEKFTKQLIIEMPEPENEFKPKEYTYYLLGDFLPEDLNLRKQLHSERLKTVQKQQKNNLSDQCHNRHCFICHQNLHVTNIQFINHLRSHGFHLGHPDKLVYVNELLGAIEDTIRNCRCLYCNQKFDSCSRLIAHMDDKNHMKVHPNNRFYDQFYLINYLEYGKTWMDYVKEKDKTESEKENIDDNDSDLLDETDTDWSCWGTEPEFIMCLFCKHICKSWDGTLLHMLVSHNFDFKVNVVHLDFYDQVKMVNYVRQRILKNKCINCDLNFENNERLLVHMEEINHLFIPNKDCWNHSNYFFCTMENDMLLYHLEDEDDTEDSVDNNDIAEKSNNLFKIGNSQNEPIKYINVLNDNILKESWNGNKLEINSCLDKGNSIDDSEFNIKHFQNWTTKVSKCENLIADDSMENDNNDHGLKKSNSKIETFKSKTTKKMHEIFMNGGSGDSVKTTRNRLSV